VSGGAGVFHLQRRKRLEEQRDGKRGCNRDPGVPEIVLCGCVLVIVSKEDSAMCELLGLAGCIGGGIAWEALMRILFDYPRTTI
jgi:hypothetical protein